MKNRTKKLFALLMAVITMLVLLPAGIVSVVPVFNGFSPQYAIARIVSEIELDFYDTDESPILVIRATPTMQGASVDVVEGNCYTLTTRRGLKL